MIPTPTSRPRPAAAALKVLSGEIVVGSLDIARERYIWPAHQALLRARGESLRARVKLGWTLIEVARQLSLSMQAMASMAEIHQTTFWRCVRVARAVAGRDGGLDDAAVEKLKAKLIAAADARPGPRADLLRAIVAKPVETWNRRTWEAVTVMDITPNQGKTTIPMGIVGNTEKHAQVVAAVGGQVGRGQVFAGVPCAAGVDHEPIQASQGGFAARVAGPLPSPGGLVSRRERPSTDSSTVMGGGGLGRMGEGGARAVQMTLEQVYAEARTAAAAVRATLAAIEAQIETCLRNGDVDGLQSLSRRCRSIGH